MKTLIISDFTYPQMGGVEKHIHDLGEALAKHGCEVHVATGVKLSTPMSTSQITYHTIPVQSLSCGVSLPCYSLEVLWLSKLHQTYGFDIVHCHQSYSVLALTGLLWARAAGIPAVLTEHSMARGDVFYEMLLSPIRQCSLALAHQVICVSHECEDNMRSLRHISLQHPVDIIPNIIPSSSRLSDTDVLGGCKKFQGWPPRRLRIAFVQRLVQRKGTDLIGPLVALLAANKVEADVYVAGSGPMEAHLKKLPMYQEGVRLLLLGALPNEEIRLLLSTCHIGVIPSYLEAFSMVLVEALQETCIPVTSWVGGTSSVYKNVSPWLASCCLCSPSAEEFYQRILGLQQIPQRLLVKELVAASKLACTKYTPDVISKKVYDVYEGLYSQPYPTWLSGILDIWRTEVDYLIFKVWFFIIFTSTTIFHKVYTIAQRFWYRGTRSRSTSLCIQAVQIRPIN